jgi:hypothetical protein
MSISSTPRSSASSIRTRERAAANAAAAAEAAAASLTQADASVQKSLSDRKAEEEAKFAALRLAKSKGMEEEWQIRQAHGVDFLLSPGQRPRKSPLSSRISITALKVPFNEAPGTTPGRNHDAVGFLSVRASPTNQGSLMSLNQSLRLEDREEFSYGMGIGGSMALWQQRPGLPKPLTPRSRYTDR